MKKIIFIALIGAILTACKSEPKTTYNIDGEAKGVFNGMRVYLSKVNERGAPIPKDTAIVMNEAFSFKGAVDYPQLYYVTINGTPGRFPIILENGNLDLNIDTKIIADSKFAGSESHDVFQTYDDKMKKLTEEISSARTNLQQSTFLKNTEKIKADQATLDKVTETYNTYPFEYLDKHDHSYGILPILNTQINRRDVNFEKVVSIYYGLDDNLKNSEEGLRMKRNLDLMKLKFEAEKSTAIGAVAPQFSAPNPDGEILKLKDIVTKGKVTIVDFWAAWCGPCRRENPNVVKIYDKYHDKGLEIVGVGLDGRRGQQNPKEAWKNAIEKDSLTWHQVSNLKYFDAIAQSYNVNSIPSMFILDSKGKIIAKNLRGLALENKIAELLN